MRIKSFKLFHVSLIVIISLLLITACGKSGSKFNNIAPTITITSYEGFDDSATYSSQDTLSFQQRIYWHASDPDGVIAGYAYRILDSNNNPISTPGNQYIDVNGDITPDKVKTAFAGDGWVMHYLPGADQSIPLDTIEARRSIWTSQKYTVVNFPSADANGNPLPKLSKFEVIAIDNRGDITAVAAWRKFNTESARPTCNASTSRGNPNGSEVGSGMKLSFTMNDTDPFITPVPWYYEFQLKKLDMNDNEISTTEWIRTDQNGNPKLNEYMLTRYTSPALSYDFDANGNQISKTQVVSRVYDLAGVVSNPTVSSSFTFAVKPGFRPSARLYDQKIHAIGDHHYLDYTYDDQKTPAEVMPFTVSGGVIRYAIPMFKNFDNKNAAVNSGNFKIWLRWGWWGEYGKVQSSGDVIPSESPYDKKVDAVLDATTNANYFSEITHFDLRFNDQPYNFPPYANSVQVDNDGKRWLRIPTNSVLGQTVVMNNLPSGTHKFEVRVVDLQNEVSESKVYEFVLEDHIPYNNRSGILIIDDDPVNNSAAPEPTITDKYNSMFSDYNGQIDIKRLPSADGQTFQDRRDRRLAFSDLQKYSLVVYHSDNPQADGTISQECDALVLFLQDNGNLVISGTSKLSGMVGAMVSLNQQTLLRALGIVYSTTPLVSSGNLSSNPFFQKAVGSLGYNDLNLQFGTENPSFNSLVNARHGLGAVAYFNTFNGDVIYSYGSKPTDYPNTPPNQTQYDLLNNKPVGIRKVNGNGKAYSFGFPLSYMLESDVKTLMNKIMQECGLL